MSRKASPPVWRVPKAMRETKVRTKTQLQPTSFLLLLSLPTFTVRAVPCPACLPSVLQPRAPFTSSSARSFIFTFLRRALPTVPRTSVRSHSALPNSQGPTKAGPVSGGAGRHRTPRLLPTETEVRFHLPELRPSPPHLASPSSVSSRHSLGASNSELPSASRRIIESARPSPEN